MKNLFNKYQREILSLANDLRFREELGISHVPDSIKIQKVVPNGVLTIENDKLVWRFWCGRDVIADSLLEILPDVGIAEFAKFRPFHLLHPQARFLDFPSGSGSGFCFNSDATFSTARGASSGSSHGVGGTVYSLYTELVTGVYDITRHFYPTDTSALGSGFVISSASLNLWVDSFITGGGYANNYVIATTQAATSTLADSDYSQVGSTSGGIFSTASLGATSAPLNATGIGFVSLTGVTKIGARVDGDFNNSAPSNGANEPSIGMPANGTATKRPYITVTASAGLLLGGDI